MEGCVLGADLCWPHRISVNRLVKGNAACEVHSVSDNTNFSWLPVLAGHHRRSCQCHLLLMVVQSYHIREVQSHHIGDQIVCSCVCLLYLDRHLADLACCCHHPRCNVMFWAPILFTQTLFIDGKKAPLFTCNHMVYAQTPPNP